MPSVMDVEVILLVILANTFLYIAPIQSINQSPAVMTSTISPIQPPMYLDPYAAFYEVSQGRYGHFYIVISRPVITCKELQRAIQLTGLEISLDVCNQFVKKFDIDKNGVINMSDHLRIQQYISGTLKSLC